MNIFVRLIVAVIALVAAWMIIPLFIELLGVAIPAAAIAIVRICIAVLAVIYVIFGERWWAPRPPMP